MLLKQRPRDVEKGFCPEVPIAFISIEQARNSLDYHWNNCIEYVNELEKNAWDANSTRFRGHGPLDVLTSSETVRQEITEVTEKWLVAYQAFLRKHEVSLDSRGLRAARTLEMSHSFATIYLSATTVNVFNDETAWDRFNERFEHIANLAALVVIEPSTSDNSTLKRSPSFTLDMHTVSLLYAVAHKCRHPFIRRKAVSLLYAVPRQEGIWDSVITARVAERLINIEESGLGNVTCSEDVPDWARISDVEVQFDLHERQATVKYSRLRSPLENIRDAVTESIRW